MNQMLDTSLDAYEEIRKTLGKRQRRVLKLFEECSSLMFCNKGISNVLGWPINCVTDRVKELREKGLLIDAGKRKHRGRSVHFWRIAKPKQTLFD